MLGAYSIKVRGVVQGVGFRPFVYQLAHAHKLTGWVLNGEEGVEIHAEGQEEMLQGFIRELRERPPSFASVSSFGVAPANVLGVAEFAIRASKGAQRPSVHVSPDLPVCEQCLEELFYRADRRYLYPYINCTNCGPRYTVVRNLPYDRANTTMADWPLDTACAREYGNPANRRFHAQPVACSECGPHYYLLSAGDRVSGDLPAILKSARLLREGKVLAVKGLGGYHLACDARNAQTVAALRNRKFRKEKPFAVMAKDLNLARELVSLSAESETLLTSAARPIVLAPAKIQLPGVAPGNDELGVMLPYTPVHHLLFAAAAPEILLMTSANRSSEPIAYEDEAALRELSEIADAFLVGERPIARRVDDSVVRAGVYGPAILRRSRGYAPGVVAKLPTDRPILAVGADLKNAVTLVVDGQAFVSQHIGDLNHYEAFRAFRETIDDLLAMYQIRPDEVLIVHDAHPQYVSTAYALECGGGETRAIQHHRAHIASVIAERGAWEQRVLGVSFDGTGYGDDGGIWGGEIFVGSVQDGFERVGHLRSAWLPGGDAAASVPVQAAAGYLSQMDGLPDLMEEPFFFPPRYRDALRLVHSNIRTFPTTSIGRLFDTAAALLGFTREITFEGQAAIWLEHLAREWPARDAYPFPLSNGQLDFGPLLEAAIHDRRAGRDPGEISRAFHRGIASGLCDALTRLSCRYSIDTVVLSGGVFQNELLLGDIHQILQNQTLRVWTNSQVPANDGGISLGQAALAAIGAPQVVSAERTGRLHHVPEPV